MKAPRYLLREAVLNHIFKSVKLGRVLEIGHGSGDFLAQLSKLGFVVDGYDFSEDARVCAQKLIETQNLKGVRVLSTIEPQARYEYICFFEVFGYWADPLGELLKLNNQLVSDGELIFSFTNQSVVGSAEKLTGDMKCFTRAEIIDLLTRAGMRIEVLWNYGYPLSNLLRPGLHLLHCVFESRRRNASKLERIQQSGASPFSSLSWIAQLLVNRWSLAPFIWLQMKFRNSDRGTGYIVVAARDDFSRD